ncbi:hypothetical protein F5Y18DRAFT_351712 [Xylariaceae sp. FL1019]|nr:hypothetical protein F5Y18DRAFT_351712 [Xylariaceae sp. FL1019]
MVGVPKSKRCTFCRARKTKCDENWPTCGACSRAGKICSGARTALKFVVNGSHNEVQPYEYSANEEAFSPTPRRERRAVETRRRGNRPISTSADLEQGLVNGGIAKYQRWRPWQMPPEHSPPLQATDKIIAQFLCCLRAAPGTGNDLRILGAFVELVPQQLSHNGSNSVLGHAVELLISAWTNSQRGLEPSSWLDLRMYNKALRSLKNALDDARVEEDTLAAQCMLQKTEVLYDFSRGSNQENHAAGLIAVISKAGPNQHMSDVELHVMFEGLFHMLQEDIRQDRSSAFHTPEWMSALRRVLNNNTSINDILKQTYDIWIEVTAWPDLVCMVRRLRKDPSDKATATTLRRRAGALARYLQRKDDTTLRTAFKTGAIWEIDNSSGSPLIPTRYDFANHMIAKMFCCHATFSIVSCRLLQEADRALGRADPCVEEKAKELGRRIWKTHPWIKSKMPLAVDFTAPLVFAYESGNEEERAFCIQSLSDMESFRQPPPIGQWVEETIMANAKAYTGRLPFLKTQDPKVEYDGLGCRS